MTDDRTWKIWVCPLCWEHIYQEDDLHVILQDGEWRCVEEDLEIVPQQIEVSRYLVTAH